MKKGLFILAGIAALAATAGAQFTTGRLAVSVFGDGLAALSGSATQIRVQEYDLGGTAWFSVTMPTANSGSHRKLTGSGTATSEGMLTLSKDGNYLSVQGYDAALGTATVAATASNSTNRVVGSINLAGTVDTTTAFDAYNAGNIRSSASVDGSHFWTAGTSSSSGGMQNMDLGGANLAMVAPTPTNLRVANIFSNQLYVSSATGAFVGVSTVGVGLPTGTGNTVTLAISTAGTGTGTASPYDFYFADPNTCYIADDRTTANGGGIQKWVFSGTWSLAYTLSSGLTAGLRGLTGTTDGAGNNLLYATTADSISAANGNKLVGVTDTGAASAYATIATAGGNTAFRGVDLTPVPEPASLLAIGAGLALLIARRKR